MGETPHKAKHCALWTESSFRVGRSRAIAPKECELQFADVPFGNGESALPIAACNAFRQKVNLVSTKNTGLANLNLPSFLWLWKIAAWAMGGAIAFYLLLFVSGALMFYSRVTRIGRPSWLRNAHYIGGIIIVFLVVLLLAIGVVGTVGYYGSLGHSPHLWSGLFVVGLICLSAWSANQIDARNDWARSLHITTNTVLFVGLAYVSWTGWAVVQKYL